MIEPDFDLFALVELGVVEYYVETAGNGLVEYTDAVGREEEDTGVVFEDAEKDCGLVLVSWIVLCRYSEGESGLCRRVVFRERDILEGLTRDQAVPI